MNKLKTLQFLTACAVLVLFATSEVAVHVLLEQPLITLSILPIGGLLIAGGFLRGERFTGASLRNVIPLLVAGVITLTLMTLLRGRDNLWIVVFAGGLCLATSCAVVAIEKNRRYLTAGVQAILLLYVWGLVPLWCMAVADDWL